MFSLLGSREIRWVIVDTSQTDQTSTHSYLFFHERRDLTVLKNECTTHSFHETMQLIRVFRLITDRKGELSEL
jgi:hypothetical protein